MAYFNLDAWTKDTVNGLNETIFGYLTESGEYVYTASGTQADEARFFRDTGSAIIYLTKLFKVPNTVFDVSFTSSIEDEVETPKDENVETYVFESKYPFTFPYIEGAMATEYVSGSDRVISYASGSLPFQ